MKATAPSRRALPFRRRQRRALLLGLVLPAFAGATALAVTAISRTQVYAYAPSALPASDELAGRTVKLGGLVEEGSLRHGAGTEVYFAVTDGAATVPVRFDGFLPSLVAEGDGAVVTGTVSSDGTFEATLVAARHDELYMAPEVADALKSTGRYDEYVAQKRR
ncbi:cytochrome c maturation protein CcmE [Parvularcula dongshanensis]|uniref:Cytochrome c-type biogenesis protein CcmE n=1 Tax=Parvularcula dongshanensis TaxID=1173995 RepID=A0A840I4R8_9PROT|nr:cytochrome c maturation protein CcmE [Parvularcula dongshanensis]MBB4659777.1 cytochrome c-type biogenesis protein CcmE [Parvularcula dongshanensis]